MPPSSETKRSKKSDPHEKKWISCIGKFNGGIEPVAMYRRWGLCENSVRTRMGVGDDVKEKDSVYEDGVFER
jgi:hypothetical protein